MRPDLLRRLVAANFVAVALWALKPGTVDERTPLPAHGASAATAFAFFVAETGDRTPVATMLLAARYDAFMQTVVGTTLGMLPANGPVVLLGARFADRLPLRAARLVASAVFALLAGWVVWRGLN